KITRLAFSVYRSNIFPSPGCHGSPQPPHHSLPLPRTDPGFAQGEACKPGSHSHLISRNRLAEPKTLSRLPFCTNDKTSKRPSRGPPQFIREPGVTSSTCPRCKCNTRLHCRAKSRLWVTM